jgi:hypothetical protein
MAKFNLNHLVEKDRLRPPRRPGELRIVHVRGDDAGSSSISSSLGSRHSSLEQQRCRKGLDMIESFFNTILGVCCRPDSCASPHESSDTSYRPVGRGKNYNGDRLESIPQPPEIRRLALDVDDRCMMPDVDQSGSLRFLFYQG